VIRGSINAVSKKPNKQQRGGWDESVQETGYFTASLDRTELKMVTNHGSREPDGRALTRAERELLSWLLNLSDSGRQYLDQVSKLRVVGSCSCGCPTIDFAAPEQTVAARGPSTIVADGEGTVAEGGRVGVIVHVREGALSELEVYALDAKTPFSLPSIDSCELY
jgi:hypothetical protein